MSRFPVTRTGRRTILLGLLFATLASSEGLAQVEEKGPVPPSQRPENPEYRFDFGLVGGGHFFTKQHVLGGNDELASPVNSGMFGAILGLHFNRWIGLEGEVHAIPTHTRDLNIKEWVFAYRGSFVLNLSDSYVFQPFLLAGYGGLLGLNGTAPEGTPDEQIPPSTRNWGMVHAGLGFKIGFTPEVGIRLDGRILAPWTAILPLGGYAKPQGPDFEAFGGFYVNFSEIERVHIYSKVSERADKDGDGIPNDVDKCPTEPEDKDGFQDDDGCPDPDNDNDGIPDALDKCPNDAEDKDGFEDTDGCPDPDNDRDGIPDAVDKCPNEPETVNKYKDEDGCPDEVPAEVKKFTGVIEGINFKTGSAEILPGSFAILDRALKVLQDYPDVNLEISGHTDNRGKATYNLTLSQHRADSVKLYFVSRGVSSSRLTSVGYGKDRPIADNSTSSGRGTNRRTEFRLISPGER